MLKRKRMSQMMRSHVTRDGVFTGYFQLRIVRKPARLQHA